MTRQKHFLSSNLKSIFLSLGRKENERSTSLKLVKYVFLYGVNVTTSVVQVCLSLVAAYISSKVFFLLCCSSLKRRTFFQSSPLTLASTCSTKSRKQMYPEPSSLVRKNANNGAQTWKISRRSEPSNGFYSLYALTLLFALFPTKEPGTTLSPNKWQTSMFSKQY